MLKLSAETSGAPLGNLTRSCRSEDGVDERAPYEVTRDCELVAENMHRRCRRQSPQDKDKGTQRYDCAEQADADTQRLIDEQLDVVGQTLIRVIGRITLKLHSVMVRVVQPLAEMFGGHPAAPADLKPLIEIELVDRKHDKDGGQHRKDYDFPNKTVPVFVLQGV
jgi:hypothetical protein